MLISTENKYLEEPMQEQRKNRQLRIDQFDEAESE